MKTRRVLVFLLTLGILATGVLVALNQYGKRTTKVPVPVPQATTEARTEPETEPVTEALTEAVTEPDTEETPETTEDTVTSPAQLRIAAVGDIMFHQPQINYAQTADGFDFSESFSWVSPYLLRADFAIGNYETTSNPDSDWASYPQFNTPPESLDAVRDAGFDALATANNHCIDTYQSGIVSTRQAIQGRGMLAFGTREQAGERVTLTEVNDISIALLSYTYGFNGLEQSLSDAEYTDMVNPLDPDAIETDIAHAKELGAELVIIYPHWGVEYSREPSEDQQYLAHRMIEWGADLVLGSHPHVVQGQEWVQRDDGTNAYIIYSMGNFISGQRLEFNEDVHVEQSVLLDIAVSRNEQGQINVDSVDTLPLWVDRTDAGLYRTVPTEDGLGQFANQFEEWKLDRIRAAQNDTLSILTLAGDEE